MKGGGVPAQFFTHLALIYIWHDEVSLQNEALLILEKFADGKLYNYVCEFGNMSYQKFADKPVTEILNTLSTNLDLDVNDLGNFTFYLTGLGAVFCLENKTAAPQKILRKLLINNKLSLNDFGLQELPPEIGELQELESLDISYNHFTTLPPTIAKLKNLKFLSYNNTPLSKSTKDKLPHWLPKVFAQKRYDAGLRAYYDQKYETAIKHFDKALRISPDFASAWNWKGYCLKFLNNYPLSRVCFEESIKYDDGDAFAWANLVEALCNLKEYEQTLAICEQALQLLPQMHKKTFLDESNIWFIKGLAHFWRKEYTEAQIANDHSISFNNYAGAWYNKACAYSKQNDKPEMLRCLETAIKMDIEYLEMSEKDEDLDFNDFYEDKDFIALKDKYKT
jgi:tetratricopeptide (TPR) repeat protein